MHIYISLSQLEIRAFDVFCFFWRGSVCGFQMTLNWILSLCAHVLLFDIFYLNAFILNVGLLAVIMKTCPYSSDTTRGAVRVPQELFHYSLSVEQLQYLSLNDIITALSLLFNLTRNLCKLPTFKQTCTVLQKQHELLVFYTRFSLGVTLFPMQVCRQARTPASMPCQPALMTSATKASHQSSSSL